MTRRISQLALTVVFIDEYDALTQEGPFPFSGDKDGSAIEKAQDFLSVLPGLPAAPAAGAEERPNREQRRAVPRKRASRRKT